MAAVPAVTSIPELTHLPAGLKTHRVPESYKLYHSVHDHKSCVIIPLMPPLSS